MSRSVFIGSVVSSKVALEVLLECGVKIDLVCALDEKRSKGVSDFYPLHQIALDHGIPHIKFNKINDKEVVDKIAEIEPDFIYVIGLSQLISNKILTLAKKFAIGFHPTALPLFRGRAAIPWQIILGVRQSKISLFKLDEGMDSGDILYQYPYTIEQNDYAMDVYNKVCCALREGLKRCIPMIYSGKIKLIKQDNEIATYLLARRPEDGKIDWGASAKEIETLIRATSKPYPGAFAYYKDHYIRIWRCRIEDNKNFFGIPGQIAWINQAGEIGVVTKDAMLVITEYELENKSDKLIVGRKFV